MRTGSFAIRAGVLILVSSCGLTGRTTLSPSDYVQWGRSEGYPHRSVQHAGDIRYDLTYLTPQFELAQSILMEEITTEDAQAENRGKATVSGFQLKITLPGSGQDIYTYNPESAIDLSKRSEYFAFGLKKDIRLVTKYNDTLQSSFMITEKGISRAPYTTVLFEFPISPDKISELIFDDKALSGTTVHFGLPSIDTNKNPKLRID